MPPPPELKFLDAGVHSALSMAVALGWSSAWVTGRMHPQGGSLKSAPFHPSQD